MSRGHDFYADHVERFGLGIKGTDASRLSTAARHCACEPVQADPKCDVGEALWRVRLSQLLKRPSS